jgi:hypothetical protein
MSFLNFCHKVRSFVSSSFLMYTLGLSTFIDGAPRRLVEVNGPGPTTAVRLVEVNGPGPTTAVRRVEVNGPGPTSPTAAVRIEEVNGPGPTAAVRRVEVNGPGPTSPTAVRIEEFTRPLRRCEGFAASVRSRDAGVGILLSISSIIVTTRGASGAFLIVALRSRDGAFCNIVAARSDGGFISFNIVAIRVGTADAFLIVAFAPIGIGIGISSSIAGAFLIVPLRTRGWSNKLFFSVADRSRDMTSGAAATSTFCNSSTTCCVLSASTATLSSFSAFNSSTISTKISSATASAALAISSLRTLMASLFTATSSWISSISSNVSTQARTDPLGHRRPVT